jgi:hypothetical protein
MKHQATNATIFLLFALLFVCFNSIAQRARPKAIKWNIPGIPSPGLSNKQVSGQPALYLPQVNKNKEAIYWFAKRPYSPGQSFVDSTEPRKLAASILGRMVSMNPSDPFVENPAPCATTITSPFTVADVERNAEYGTGYKFTIKQSRVRNLNTSANVEADILKLVGSAQAASWVIDSLRAELNAGYSRLNNIDVKITGTYEVYQLSGTVIDKLGRPDQKYFSDCQTHWAGRQNSGANEGIITSIGFVTYNVDYSQTIADSLAIKIDALLARSGLNVGAKFVIDNRVKTNIDASINRGYQVLVWKKVPLDAFRRV